MTNNVVARFRRRFADGGAPAADRRVVRGRAPARVVRPRSGEPVRARPLRAARHIVEYGLTDVRQIGRILLTGAMVVVPVWLVLRLLDAGRTR